MMWHMRVSPLNNESNGPHARGRIKVHRMGYDEGVHLFGPKFANFEKFASMHNAVSYCYHGGNQFVTSHPVFTLMLDQAMQSIDASVTTPYWDFMIDGAVYGADWWFESPTYSSRWFDSYA